jgi:hypothetical protein
MKRISILKIGAILMLTLALFGTNYNKAETNLRVENDNVSISAFLPNEQRGKEFRKYLAASVRININGAAGSGTICHYDPENNWAYVLSCGHLLDGTKTYKESDPRRKCKITTWYNNDIKLSEPKTCDGEVLFWSNVRGRDCSLLRFKPDWKPDYFPIASVDFPISKNTQLNSLGCDEAGEVARYEVELLEITDFDLVTKKNSPRPGRSGGGLVTNSGWIVGICWGTTDVSSGDGVGYFTPLKSIHDVLNKNNHGWILKQGGYALRNIPIYDWTDPDNKLNWEYIPVP